MLTKLQERESQRQSQRQFWTYYPDTGPLRRELYGKHLEFFALGATCSERAFVAGNRVGKTTAAGYEVVCHATGRYPAWWPGYRFARPVGIWACGIDAKWVRDTIQLKLLGAPGQLGTGLLPLEDIVGRTSGGVPESVDTVRVTSQFGDTSSITFKNYEQDRESYQGATKDVVWFDEEPTMQIYSEGLTRTMSVVPGEENGRVMCTFTPLLGLSDVIRAFMPQYGART